jgi:Flp pilus assembly protein TadG
MTARRRRRSPTGGIVALEFALVAPALVGLLLFIAQLGFLLYAQTALDYAAKQAARQMQTGQAIANAGSAATYQSLVFCPFLQNFISCSSVVIVLEPVTDYQTAMKSLPTTTSVAAGQSGSLMLLQATYTPPITKWPLNVGKLVGTAAYRNEF